MFEECNKKTIEILNSITKLGIALPNPPSEETKVTIFPSNMNDLSNYQIGTHLSAWTEYLSFAQFHAALIDTDRVFNEERYERAVMKYLSSNPGDKRTLKEKRGEADLDPDIANLKVKYLTSLSKYNMLKALCDGFSRKYEAISREQSRRSSLEK